LHSLSITRSQPLTQSLNYSLDALSQPDSDDCLFEINLPYAMSYDEALDDVELRFIALLPHSVIDDPIQLMKRIELAHWYYLDNHHTYYKSTPTPLPEKAFNDFLKDLFDR
jgi:hypothetical protein